MTVSKKLPTSDQLIKAIKKTFIIKNKTRKNFKMSTVKE